MLSILGFSSYSKDKLVELIPPNLPQFPELLLSGWIFCSEKFTKLSSKLIIPSFRLKLKISGVVVAESILFSLWGMLLLALLDSVSSFSLQEKSCKKQINNMVWRGELFFFN